MTQYDVGASDSDTLNLVGHVLLCDIDAETKVSSKSPQIQAVHMGPPLKESLGNIDVIGTAGLDVGDARRGERRQIKSFVDDRLLERRAQVARLEKLGQRLNRKSEYIIYPASKEPDANYPLWRFNCSGFVLHAYLEANVELIDQDNVPLVTLEFLKKAYPSAAKWLDDPDFRKEMGIDFGDRWAVIMAGYVVNSLSRSTIEIRDTPYRPHLGDEFFPTFTSEADV